MATREESLARIFVARQEQRNSILVLILIAPHQPQVVALIFIGLVTLGLLYCAHSSHHQIATPLAQHILQPQSIVIRHRSTIRQRSQKFQCEAVETIHHPQLGQTTQRAKHHDVASQTVVLESGDKRKPMQTLSRVVYIHLVFNTFGIQVQQIFHGLVVAILGQKFQIVVPSLRQIILRPRHKGGQQHKYQYRQTSFYHRFT